MKRLSLITILFSVILLFSSNIYSKPFSKYQTDVIVKNLVKGINSENRGLRIGAALRIFEFIEKENFNKDDFALAVVPLMKMLREGKSELERVAAALSLYKIEDGRGIYFLRGAARFDESEKVRKVGKNLYYNYHQSNGSAYFVDF